MNGRPNLVIENKGRYVYCNTFIEGHQEKTTQERERITSEKVAVKAYKPATATSLDFKLIAYNDDNEDHDYTIKVYQKTAPNSFTAIGIFDGASILDSYSFSLSKRSSKELRVRFTIAATSTKGQIANCILRIERDDDETQFDTVQTIVIIHFADYEDVKRASEYFVTDEVLFPSGAYYGSQAVVEKEIELATEEIAYWSMIILQGTSFAHLEIAKSYCIVTSLLRLLERAMVYVLSGGVEFMPIYDRLKERQTELAKMIQTLSYQPS